MSDAMTDAELEAIRQRCQKATPGPWWAAPTSSEAHSFQINRNDAGKPVTDAGSNAGYQSIAPHVWPRDVAFITCARADIPALLAEVEQLSQQYQQSLSLAAEMQRQRDEAAAFEREACAKVADGWNTGLTNVANLIAAAIRARTD